MLKNISNLGKSLSKGEQQSINGGAPLCSYCGYFIPNMIVCANGEHLPCPDDLR